MPTNGELAPMEGAGDVAGIDNAPALRKQRDDFGSVPQSEADAQAALQRELAIKPQHRNPCTECGTVHPVDGDPICRCVKCGGISRIVWCGQCVQCAHTRFADRFGEGVANIIYPQYAAWLHKQREEQAQKNKMPWESQ